MDLCGNDRGRNDRKRDILIVRLNNISGWAIGCAYMEHCSGDYAGIRAYLCGAFHPFP